MTWADVFAAEYARTVGWAQTFAHCDADEIVQDAFVRSLGRPVPDDPAPWIRAIVKRVWSEHKRARAREMAWLRGAGPVLCAEGDVSLVPMERVSFPQYRNKRALTRVPCSVCDKMYTPSMVKGRRKATCGAPSCVARLRERRRAAA